MTAPDVGDTLRWAAKVLREHAEAATDGPWRVAAEGSEGSRIAPDCEDKRERVRWIANVNGRVQPEDGRNARYMALVDPAVGLALADWLDRAVSDAELLTEFGDETVEHSLAEPLAVARAILREAPDA